ncbi:MAG TPA: extracellular solute-binding protein [Geminicoccus sp.]|uniref:extracellular solute-binding protein n=1 Tax=Geminicoccus sp. TaxID=2024832 RepID=UPI002E3170BC|nr:extracellular solute-binding protein [Geminicoccus sp.]HEX2527864.1 extracellular solute-binding protein [Geminicoccus sp.]
MKKSWRGWLYGASMMAVLVGGAGIVPTSAQAADITINMAAPDWPPTRFMKEEFDRSFKSKSGDNIQLVMDFIPWPSFYERVAASLTSGEKKYQMIVTDSQWLGSFVDGGYYKDLTEIMKKDPELSAIMKDIHPALVSAYSTYPNKSRKFIEENPFPAPDTSYYGFPQFPDTYVTFYRQDLFCNEKEAAKFQETFNAKLPCTYEDWQDVDWTMYENIGKHFMRKKGEPLGDGVADDDFFGISYQAGKGYDFSTMQVNAFIWQAGGDIWDETKQPEAQAEGVVNSDTNVKAFEHYLSLIKYMPPVAATGQADIFVIQDLFMQGKVASTIDWVGLGEPVLDPKTSRVHDKSAFAPAPGTRKEDGTIDRTGNIGGQPFVLTTWNSPEVDAAGIEVVKWWLQPDTQKKFVANGGQSGLMSVMADPEYDSLRPWNRAHKEMIDWQRDVWHVPEFFELLTQQQEEFDKAITGQVSAQEALDAVARFQQQTLEDAGRIE